MMAPIPPMIRVRNLHKHFGSSHVLRGVDLDIARGEVFVIIGRSGSGKSTLLRCLNFLVEYDEGEVSFNDVLVGYRRRSDGRLVRDSESNINQLRAQMGMVCQSFNLFPHMSVLENVIEGPVFVRHMARRDAVAMAEELLAKVGLADKAAAYPSTLSGGQQQRAAIARALAMEPKAILFDEPTSALDPVEGIEHRALRGGALDREAHLALDARQLAQMCGQHDADHGDVCTSTDSTGGRSRTIGVQLSPPSGET